jgi:hypothetical protein
VAELLRATLAVDHAHEHALADELALTESYLDIEKARLGERLRIAIDIGPDLLDAQVPCLLLQPLVENAVRHGIAPDAAGGTLALGIAGAGGMLHITLANDARVEAAGGASHGVGIRNVAERLKKLYDGGHGFTARHLAGSRFEVAIELPLRRAAAAGREYLVRTPLHRLVESLDPAAFARVHRSAIVRLDRVAELRTLGNRDAVLRLRDGTPLRASRTYIDALLAALERQRATA